jgi:hypothetical protein
MGYNLLVMLTGGADVRKRSAKRSMMRRRVLMGLTGTGQHVWIQLRREDVFQDPGVYIQKMDYGRFSSPKQKLQVKLTFGPKKQSVAKSLIKTIY